MNNNSSSSSSNNKSTPINQLPNPQQQQQLNQQNGQFENDQHRQVVTQARSAVQNFSMPVNTQLGGDYTRDEDATIQETLMNLNGSDAPTIVNQLAPLQAPTNVTSPNVASANIQQNPNQITNPNTNTNMNTHMNTHATAPNPNPNNHNHTNMYAGANGTPIYNDDLPKPSWWSFVGDSEDLKTAILVALITIAMTLIPVSRLLHEYLPCGIAQLPYMDIAGKASVAGIVFYVLRAIII